jgi:hypothetical protein
MKNWGFRWLLLNWPFILLFIRLANTLVNALRILDFENKD